MTSALVTMSHSPLMGFTEPADQARERVEAAFDGARSFIADFAPELAVIFGPDHYNGFFYDMMPPFCIGAAAESIGDYDTPAGPLPVDHDAALALVRGRAGRRDRRRRCPSGCTSTTVSRSRCRCCSAASTGCRWCRCSSTASRVPLGPAPPGAAARAGDRPGRGGARPPGAVRRLGRAIARPAGAGPGGRGPGGRRAAHLRGPPPDPGAARGPPGCASSRPDATTPPGSRPCSRSTRTGTGTCSPCSPPGTWSRSMLGATDWFTEQAGHSAHETRTSIAAYAALAAAGPYRVTASFYEPIPAWIAGFAVTTARHGLRLTGYHHLRGPARSEGATTWISASARPRRSTRSAWSNRPRTSAPATSGWGRARCCSATPTSTWRWPPADISTIKLGTLGHQPADPDRPGHRELDRHPERARARPDVPGHRHRQQRAALDGQPPGHHQRARPRRSTVIRGLLARRAGHPQLARPGHARSSSWTPTGIWYDIADPSTVWMAAGGPKGLALAAKHADAMTYCLGPQPGHDRRRPPRAGQGRRRAPAAHRARSSWSR